MKADNLLPLDLTPICFQVPSFENFFNDDSIGSYLRNPFGEDFIKLEIDQNNFRTNKTKVVMMMVIMMIMLMMVIINDDDYEDIIKLETKTASEHTRLRWHSILVVISPDPLAIIPRTGLDDPL